MDFKVYATVFISIMVAVNAPSVVPLFISFTEDIADDRKKIAAQSVITAFLVAAGFVLLGSIVFSAIGIDVEDFMIAGGILLLIFSIVDIVFPDVRGRHLITPTMGVVPIGTPLLAGPATLTTALVLVGNYGYIPVLTSLLANLLIAWLLLYKAEFIIRLIGLNGARAFAKVASLLLAAIAVKMIRTGLFAILKLH
ncbi:MAG TPA: MarC family protein [Dissulfurispiraceae bacterium]|nr:MarC family protein [Dissulfurispiraceae bacterium]